MQLASQTLVSAQTASSEAALAAKGAAALATVPDELLAIAATAGSERELLQRLAVSLRRQLGLVEVLCYQGPDETTPEQLIWLGEDNELLDEAAAKRLARLCLEASQLGSALKRSTTDGFPFPPVVVPIHNLDGRAASLAALCGPDGPYSIERIAEVLQLAAAQIAAWRARRHVSAAEREARLAAALLELIAHVEGSSEVADAAQTLADQLQNYSGCQRVAVGLLQGRSRHCQLSALSGMARFDRRADVSTQMEAALDEAVLLDELIHWPPPDDTHRQPARAHEQLLSTLSADSILSGPLHDGAGAPMGAWLFINPPREDDDAFEQFLGVASQPIGRSLAWLQRGRARRWSAKLGRQLGSQSRGRYLAVVLGIALLALGLAWPRPHKIGCDCKLQPVVRRYVAAPFDATLERAFVKPGDLVEKGQVLAELDGRDIRLELSALDAEYARARKAWEASLALDDIHEAQQAKLEMRRLSVKTQLLKKRQRSLEVKSPVRGIVVTGDLEDSEGAPLSVGQGLFEIAPLERMKIEVVIPEAEIAYTQAGQDLKLRLDAHPTKRLTSSITHIVPRAEIRDEQFVFVAYAELENPDEDLRPGMNGRATLIGPKRPLGWLLFHRPYESLLMLSGW